MGSEPLLGQWAQESTGTFDANPAVPGEGALLPPPPVPCRAQAAPGGGISAGAGPALLGDAYLFTFNNAPVVTQDGK